MIKLGGNFYFSFLPLIHQNFPHDMIYAQFEKLSLSFLLDK